MFAVIEVGGKQYQVEEKQDLLIEKIKGEAGKNVTVKAVTLLAKTDTDVYVGTPYVSGATVELKLVEEVKGDKIRIFKMKAKKRYTRVQGHRQTYWKAKVLKITKVNGEAKKKVTAEKEEGQEKPKKKSVKKD